MTEENKIQQQYNYRNQEQRHVKILKHKQAS